MAFTKRLFNEGTISVLYGLPGSGKTNFMVFLSEVGSFKHDFNIWSVIHFFDDNEIIEAISEGLLPPGIKYQSVPPRVHTVKRVSDLLLGVLRHKNNATILDEAGVFASTRAPMSKKLRYILNLSYIIRHLRSSFVYVTQTDKSIPPEMRESLVKYEMIIRKHDKGYRVLSVNKRKEFKNKYGKDIIKFVPHDTIGRIPLTKLPWDGHYIPKFEFDIDLDEAWNRLGEYNSLKVREKGEDIIKEMVEEAKEDEKEKTDRNREKREEAKDRYRELVRSGEYNTTKEMVTILADEFDMSFSWAYQVIRTTRN